MKNRRITLITGPSGVGKTELANALTKNAPKIELNTQAIGKREKELYLIDTRQPKYLVLEEFTPTNQAIENLKYWCTDDRFKEMDIIIVTQYQTIPNIDGIEIDTIIQLSNGSNKSTPKQVITEDEPLVHQTYDLIERLIVGKPGSLINKSEVISDAIMQALVNLGNYGNRG